ncbi:MAG: sterol desaturase family protein, partial [Lysobacterales bacterium]
MLGTDLAQYRLHLVDIVVTRSLSLMPMVMLGFSSEAIKIYLPILALQSVFNHRGEHCLLWFTLEGSADRSIEVTDKEIDNGPNNTAHEHCGIFTIPG